MTPNRWIRRRVDSTYPVLGLTVVLTIVASCASGWSQQGYPPLPHPQPQGNLKSNNVEEIPGAMPPTPTPEPLSAVPPNAPQRELPPAGGIGRPPAIEAQNGCELWRGGA